MTDLRETVRKRYAEAALSATGTGDGSCCSCDPCDDRFGSALYGATVDGLPQATVAASLGCGNPTAVADLMPGDVVLDLGSGGGIDVVLAARRVGPTGRVIGLDMTDEMLDLSRRTCAEADIDNAEFVKGYIEDIPLPPGSVDVVISNCVINLSVDKPRVFAEIARVLRDGGRLGVSDVVAEDHLAPDERAARGSYVGCIAGALSVSEYTEALTAVGVVDVEIELTHRVADGMHAAIIRGTRA